MFFSRGDRVADEKPMSLGGDQMNEGGTGQVVGAREDISTCG